MTDNNFSYPIGKSLFDFSYISNIITSDDLKEAVALAEEVEEAGETLSEDDAYIRDEAKRLLEEYRQDFYLIRYSHAEDYIQEMIEDCYSIPKELEWLFFHVDWEGVVRDMVMGGDWMEDEFCDTTFYVEVR